MPQDGPVSETDMSDSKIYNLAPAATFETVGDGAVILLSDSGQLFSCNETSETFLRHLDGKRSIGDIAELMEAEYEVSRDELEADLHELAAQLEAEGVIVSGA